MAGLVVGKVCPGVKNRTGAFIGLFVCIFSAALMIILAKIALIFTYREDPTNPDRRSNEQREMLNGYYGTGMVVWGSWILFTILAIGGVKVENKRALFLWICWATIVPFYFIAGLIFLLSTKLLGSWETAYLVAQGLVMLAMIWVVLAVWVYLGEVRQRDKNPELRENEVLFAQPFQMGPALPSGAYNPGYGGGSMSSVARSSKSRHTYAPTEVGSVRTTHSVPRQSRLDQYRQQQYNQPPPKRDSPEREGATTYYRYQYQAEQHHTESSQQYSGHHASQGSLGGRQVPQYHGSQGSLGGREMPARQYQDHPDSRPVPRQYPGDAGSQGSLNGVGRPRQYPGTGSQGSLSGVGRPAARQYPSTDSRPTPRQYPGVRQYNLNGSQGSLGHSQQGEDTEV